MAAKKKIENNNTFWYILAGLVVVALVAFFVYRTQNTPEPTPLPEFTEVEESAQDDMVIEDETMEETTVTATPSATPAEE